MKHQSLCTVKHQRITAAQLVNLFPETKPQFGKADAGSNRVSSYGLLCCTNSSKPSIWRRTEGKAESNNLCQEQDFLAVQMLTQHICYSTPDLISAGPWFSKDNILLRISIWRIWKVFRQNAFINKSLMMGIVDFFLFFNSKIFLFYKYTDVFFGH